MDSLLKAFGKTVADAHPTVEQLTNYQSAPQRLMEKDRQTIEQHLRHCPDCAEELTSLGSFVSAQLSKKTAARKERLTIWASIQAVYSRVLEAIPQLFLRPAFAYALAILVSIPTIYSYLTAPVLRDSTRSPNRQVLPQSQTLPSLDIHAPRAEQPYPIAQALLTAYKTAYEARDLSSLQQVWDMGSEKASELGLLFAQTRALSLLVDLTDVHSDKQDEQIVAAFVQVRTWVGEDGVVRYERPSRCTADIRRGKDSRAWYIWDLEQRELSQKDEG